MSDNHHGSRIIDFSISFNGHAVYAPFSYYYYYYYHHRIFNGFIISEILRFL